MTVCMTYCSADRFLDRLFFHSSIAFPTGWVSYGSIEGKSAHLWVHSYLLLVDDFANVLHAVDCSPYCSFCRSSTSIIQGWFAYRIPQRMAADYTFLHSSMAFMMVFAPYFSMDGGRLIFLSLVNSFYDGLRTVLLHGWQWIAHTSACQQLSQQFTRHNTQQMAADC